MTEQEVGAGKMLDWLRSNGYIIALRGPSRIRHGGTELFPAMLPRDYAIASALEPRPAEQVARSDKSWPDFESNETAYS